MLSSKELKEKFSFIPDEYLDTKKLDDLFKDRFEESNKHFYHVQRDKYIGTTKNKNKINVQTIETNHNDIFAFSSIKPLNNKSQTNGKKLTVVAIGANPSGEDNSSPEEMHAANEEHPYFETTRRNLINRVTFTMDEQNKNADNKIQLGEFIQLDLFCDRTKNSGDINTADPTATIGKCNPAIINYWVSKADWLIPCWGKDPDDASAKLENYNDFIKNDILKEYKASKKGSIYLLASDKNYPAHPNQRGLQVYIPLVPYK